MCVDVSSVSDHSFIVESRALGIDSDRHVNKVVDRRRWRDLDSASFTAYMVNSRLVADPPGDVDSLFACYDETPKSLVDKYAPLIKMKVSSRPTAPWFDAGCRIVKINTGAPILSVPHTIDLCCLKEAVSFSSLLPTRSVQKVLEVHY